MNPLFLAPMLANRCSRLIPFSKIALYPLSILLSCQVSPAAIPKFQDGDRICFIGDSITKQGGYHAQILLFYTTRFPQYRLSTWNCGIAGDTAAGAVKRYAWDIAPHKPTIATIMTGMNDLKMGLYEPDKSGSQIEESRKKALQENTSNVEKLTKLLMESGSKIILIGPSIYDQTGNQKEENRPGYNDSLKIASNEDRKLTEKYQLGFVDFNAPLESLNKNGQAKDPNFTIVGTDRVHPGPVGHLVMAYLFLTEQNHSPIVSAVEINAPNSSLVRTENCTVTKLTASDQAVSFESLENSLPFPVDEAAQKALDMVPFMTKLNQETLKITGLKKGRYSISIDNLTALQTSSEELSNGINLATVRETPQYKQAVEVQKTLLARADVEINKLRPLAQVPHWYFSDLKERTPEAENEALQKQLEKLRASTSKTSSYYIGMIETYQKTASSKIDFENQFNQLLDTAYSQNKPKPHTYEIRLTDNN